MDQWTSALGAMAGWPGASYSVPIGCCQQAEGPGATQATQAFHLVSTLYVGGLVQRSPASLWALTNAQSPVRRFHVPIPHHFQRLARIACPSSQAASTWASMVLSLHCALRPLGPQIRVDLVHTESPRKILSDSGRK